MNYEKTQRELELEITCHELQKENKRLIDELAQRTRQVELSRNENREFRAGYFLSK